MNYSYIEGNIELYTLSQISNSLGFILYSPLYYRILKYIIVQFLLIIIVFQITLPIRTTLRYRGFCEERLIRAGRSLFGQFLRLNLNLFSILNTAHYIFSDFIYQYKQQLITSRWWQSPRFQNVKRSYTALQVAACRGSITPTYYSNYMAQKFYNLIQDLKQQKKFSFAMGALDTVQVINMSKYLTSIYVSGWQCSSTASSANLPGPDFADYPSNTVPQKCDQLTRVRLISIQMQRMQDRRQKFEVSQSSQSDIQSISQNDYLVPLICDADAGFGGTTSVLKLIQMFIEAGAAAIHIEDQRPDLKKCGHMSGKVLTSTKSYLQKLQACRLQADIMNNELVLIARTDGLDAKFIESNVDPIDQPFILGLYKDKKLTFVEAGLLQVPAEKEQIWSSQAPYMSLEQAKKLAQSLGFTLEFDWEACRNPDGFYAIKGCVELCAARGKHYLTIADALWMETSTPNLAQAKQLSDALQYELQNNKFLCYNCSPSFNWSKFGFSDKDLKEFNIELGKLGYTWQFITLAGFHLNALLSEKLSKDIKDRNMLAYVSGIQRKEEKHQVDQMKHQKWSGAEFFDYLTKMVNQNYLISNGSDSTENQFK